MAKGFISLSMPPAPGAGRSSTTPAESAERWASAGLARDLLDDAVAELVKLMYVLDEYVSAEVAAKYTPLREQIDRAIKAGKLSEGFTPAEYIIWARDNGIAVPKELKRAIKEGNEIHDLRARCDSISRERDTLKRERDELRAALEESERRHNRKALRTLYRMIYGMAQCKWGHDHRRVRSSVAREISDALEKQGIRVHRDTIRDHLAEAIDELPENWELENPL
jgi:hypothetical protein